MSKTSSTVTRKRAKRITSAILTSASIAGVVSGLTTLSAHAATSDVMKDGMKTPIVHSGKAATLEYTGNFPLIYQKEPSNHVSQIFTVHADTSGYIKFESDNTGHCLTDWNNTVRPESCSSPSAAWVPHRYQDGSYSFENKNTKRNMGVDGNNSYLVTTSQDAPADRFRLSDTDSSTVDMKPKDKPQDETPKDAGKTPMSQDEAIKKIGPISGPAALPTYEIYDPHNWTQENLIRKACDAYAKLGGDGTKDYYEEAFGGLKGVGATVTGSSYGHGGTSSYGDIVWTGGKIGDTICMGKDVPVIREFLTAMGAVKNSLDIGFESAQRWIHRGNGVGRGMVGNELEKDLRDHGGWSAAANANPEWKDVLRKLQTTDFGQNFGVLSIPQFSDRELELTQQAYRYGRTSEELYKIFNKLKESTLSTAKELKIKGVIDVGPDQVVAYMFRDVNSIIHDVSMDAAKDGQNDVTARAYQAFNSSVLNPLIPTTTFEITNAASGKAIDSSAVTGNATHWDADNSGSQSWALAADEAGSFKLMSKSSGKCLESEGKVEDGAKIKLNSCSLGDPKQSWQIRPAGDGSYRIVSVATGKVVEVGDSKKNGDELFQWMDNGGKHQKWKLRATGTSTVPDAPSAKSWNGLEVGATYTIQSRASGLFATPSAQGFVSQLEPNGTGDEKWVLRKRNSTLNGQYDLESVKKPGTCMVRPGTPSKLNNIEMAPCNTQFGWNFTELGNGLAVIHGDGEKALRTIDHRLDPKAALVYSDGRINTTDTAAQWKLTKVS